VVAQRIALTLRRHEAAETRALHLAAADARLIGTDPELAFVKASLRDAFQRALTDALKVLDDRQRMVYRLHVIDGLTVEAIADMYSVVRSTVTRWIATARAAIIDEAKRLLRDEMHLPAQDFESLAGLLASQLDLSISQILARTA
jgi:RNA polymerase sigma-70 factor